MHIIEEKIFAVLEKPEQHKQNCENNRKCGSYIYRRLAQKKREARTAELARPAKVEEAGKLL